MTLASPNGVVPGPEPILALHGVRASYGAIEVLHGIDLTVPSGGIFAVLGPNGAGKSTLLKVVSGLHPASSGSIVMAGREVNRARPDDPWHAAGSASSPKGRGVFPNLTVEENLRLITTSAWVRVRSRSGPMATFRRSRFAASRWQAHCPVASSRCWPSRAPSRQTPACF